MQANKILQTKCYPVSFIDKYGNNPAAIGRRLDSAAPAVQFFKMIPGTFQS
jgi:hypothetical protein